MADASNVQTEFLGGEFSPYAQGRLDDPEYKRGMNVCRNTWPIESGAAIRRSGSKELNFTRMGQIGKILPFSFTNAVPYTMEFTDGILRFRDNQMLILAEEPRQVVRISTGSPAQITTSSPCGDTEDWNAGDSVIFNFPVPGISTAGGALIGHQFRLVAGVDQEHWFLFDAVTGQPVNGANVAWNNTLFAQVGRIFEIETPYINGQWSALRAVQDQDSILLLHPTIKPYVIFAPVDGGNSFTFNPAQFVDGPYLYPPGDGSYLVVNGVSGIVSLEVSYPTWSDTVDYPDGTYFFAGTQTRAGAALTNVEYSAGGVVFYSGHYYVSIQNNNTNHTPTDTAWWKQINDGSIVGPSGFTDADIGRSVRLFAEPLQWLVGTDYTVGQLVKYQDAYYSALVANTGNIPGADAVNWGVASNAAAWTWAIITAVTSAVQVDAQIMGDPLLYDQNVLTWRLGVYADSTSYPSCGTFHEGRFWLGGAVKNRFDASKSDGNTYDFTPTSADGTVSDDNAISETLLSKEQNQILWMTPALGGILMGTAQCEWLVQSTVNNDPITPTNIQGHDHTSWGSANVDVVRTGQTVAFVQRFGNMVMEYLADLWSGKPAGKNLSLRSKHLTGKGVVRLAYQQELVPILWALTADKKLIGTTYKRESQMVSQPPEFNGWHRHDLGSGFDVIDLIVSGAPSGLYETATIITQDPATGYCRVEAITEVFQETDVITDAWYVDCGVIPQGAAPATVNSVNGLILSGLGALEGQTVSAFLAGLDCGDHLVTGGQMFVPYGSDPDGSFSLAYVQNLAAQGGLKQYSFSTNVPAGMTDETFMAFPPISNNVLNNFTYLDYGSAALTDWKNDRVTFLLPGTGPLCGFVQYTISTGAFIQYVPASTTFGSPNPPYFNNATEYGGSPIVLGSDGHLYIAIVSESYGVDPTSAGQTDWHSWMTSMPAAYNSGTTYTLGAFVVSGAFLYQSLQNSNTGNTPATSPTFWQVSAITPVAWNATTTYGASTLVTGSDNEIYWAISVVPANQGDPSGFAKNNNPFWGSAGSVWPIMNISTTGLSLDAAGDIWMYSNSGPYENNYVKISGETLILKGSSTAASGLTIPAPANYSVPLTVLNNDGTIQKQFMLETSNNTPSGASEPCAVLFEVSGMRLSAEGSTIIFDEGVSPIAAAGAPNVGVGGAYVLTRPPSGNATTAPIGLYGIAVYVPNQETLLRTPQPGYWQDPNARVEGLYGNAPQGQSFIKSGIIVPTDIDPTWTFFATVTGLLYDPIDGGVITFIQTQNPAAWASGTSYQQDDTLLSFALGSDGNVYHAKQTGTAPDPVTDGGAHWTLMRAAATQLCYMVKFTTDCARTLWTVAVNAPPSNDIGYQSVNLQGGYYDFLENLGLGIFQVRRVMTMTGQSSVLYATQKGLGQLGGVQVFNGATGDIILYPNYNSATGGVAAPPTPVDPVGGTTPVGTTFTGWGRWNVTSFAKNYVINGLVGFTFTSQGQLLRPVAAAETGARNGPAFGKTRRYHRYAMSVVNTSPVLQIGTDFNDVGANAMRPVRFKSRSGKGALLTSTAALYTGEHSDTVDDDYDLDGMLAWQITRPVPATITAIGGFITTQDR